MRQQKLIRRTHVNLQKKSKRRDAKPIEKWEIIKTQRREGAKKNLCDLASLRSMHKGENWECKVT